MHEDDERQEQQKQYIAHKQKYTIKDKDLKMYCNVGHRNCINYAQQQQQQHLLNQDKSKLALFSTTTTSETSKYDIDSQQQQQQKKDMATSNGNHQELQTKPIDNCCLPPPSPAPHSDRYYNITSLTTTNLSPYMEQHGAQDVSSSKKCTKIISDPQDFYDQENQMPKIASISTPVQRHILCNNIAKNMNNANKCLTTTTNNFDFLKSSAAFVHTPIKRYIPTPPTSTTPNEEHQAQQTQQHHVLHVSGMLSYQRLNHNKSYATVNCCSDSQQIYEQTPQTSSANELVYGTTHNNHSSSNKILNDDQQQQQQQKFSTQFTTIICNNFNSHDGDNQQQQQQQHYFNQQFEHQQAFAHKFKISNTPENYHMNNPCIYQQQHQQQQQQQQQHQLQNNDTNISTTVDSMTDNPSTLTTTTTTCLHCNNVRRTAGVHQTTQTTGPVSPVQLFIPQNDKRLIDMQQHQQQQQKQMVNNNTKSTTTLSSRLSSTSTTPTIYNYQQQQQQQQQQIQYQKKYICIYLQHAILRFLGILNDEQEIECEQNLWHERQKRFAMKRYGKLKCTQQQQQQQQIHQHSQQQQNQQYYCKQHDCTAGDLPDILATNATQSQHHHDNSLTSHQIIVEKRLSIFQMLLSAMTYLVIKWQQQSPKYHQQWSRSFAPKHVQQHGQQFHSKILYDDLGNSIDNNYDDIEDYDDQHQQQHQQQQQQQQTLLSTAVQDHEVFFEPLNVEQVTNHLKQLHILKLKT